LSSVNVRVSDHIKKEDNQPFRAKGFSLSQITGHSCQVKSKPCKEDSFLKDVVMKEKVYCNKLNKWNFKLKNKTLALISSTEIFRVTIIVIMNILCWASLI
jgi:hypothetical protein